MLARSLLCCGVGLLALAGRAAVPAPAAAPTRAAAPTLAMPVARFVSSLGVGTHVAQGYDYSKYGPALQYLGVANIRDSTGHLAGLVALHRQTGVRVDIQNGGDLKGLLDAGRTLAAAGALLSLEGANEPNNFPVTYNGRTGGGSNSWLAVASFQHDLYLAVKGDPVLKAYPVFHVSEGGAEVDDVGMQWLTIPARATTSLPPGTRYADYANPHNYVIGHCGGYVDNQAWQAADPTLNGCWDGMFGEYGRTWRHGFAGYSRVQLQTVPRVTTETGWDSVSDPGGEPVQGKVLVNTYLAQFARGWRYTFIYELGEGEGSTDHLGLFHADWSPKLAATYIHNLTAILADGGKSASHGALAYTIPNQPATVHDLLLRKSDGTFELAVWGERVQGSDDVVVRFAGRHAKVKVYDVTSGAAPVQTLADVDRVALTLSDHALVVEIMPRPAGGRG